MAHAAPTNVGILGYDIYFPRTFVSQAELETHDKAGAGKYTAGLGQLNMAFVGDREDIVSLALTVTHGLLEKFRIDPKSVGRLEVGTETIIDKSKSVKSHLMQLFQESGNTNIEGVDTMNACYGGTNALFNTINWIESSAWDGRYGIVVAGDIAIYAEGNARPTGGCGIVAMLIGPDAPIVFDRGLRGTHMEHVWDFYKPELDKEYPTVDGQLSNECYIRSIDSCYDRYRERFAAAEKRPFNLSCVDYVVYHSPYNKLVSKSFGRLLYNDMLAAPSNPAFAEVTKFASKPRETTYSDRDQEAAFLALSKPYYERMVAPGAVLQRNIGNMYCGSVYGGLISLFAELSNELVGKRVLLFSYGSGLASSMFSLRVIAPIASLVEKADVKNRMAARLKISPTEYAEALKLREEIHGAKGIKMRGSADSLFPGTYYLEEIDTKFRRRYSRKPKAAL